MTACSCMHVGLQLATPDILMFTRVHLMLSFVWVMRMLKVPLHNKFNLSAAS